MTAAFRLDELSNEEYADYQATGRLPKWAEQRMRTAHKERLLELARSRRTSGVDPTLRDNVHMSQPMPTHSIDCDLDEDCSCPATDEQIDRSFDAYR